MIAIEDAEPFWKRAFLMPLLPALWTRAAGWRPVELVLPLLTLAAVLVGALSLYRAHGMRAALLEAAASYDASYPAVIMDEEGIRLEGEGIIRLETDGKTILVDPEETVPLSDIKTTEYVVVRKREILQKRLFRTERTRVADLHQFLGDRRLDGASLRGFVARWGLVLQLGVAALVLAVMLAVESVAGGLYAAAAGGIAYGLRGRGLGLTWQSCFKVALAAYSLVLVVDTVLNLLGHSPGACFGLLIWPTVLTVLAVWRVGRG